MTQMFATLLNAYTLHHKMNLSHIGASLSPSQIISGFHPYWAPSEKWE